MTSSRILALALVLAGCRPPAPAPESPPERLEPTEPTQPERKPDVLVDVTPDATPDATPELVVAEREAVTDGVPPPGVDADATACEQSCADVHDCALIDSTYTPAAAAAIEVGCLGACLSTTERATLFGCGRPKAIEPGTCAPFLDCVGAAWPDGSGTPAPIVVEHAKGCAEACEAFGRCWNPSTTASPSEIAQCVEQCRKQLTPELERVFGSCANQPDCEAIVACVMATPGA
jgi:hypothetical protein